MRKNDIEIQWVNYIYVGLWYLQMIFYIRLVLTSSVHKKNATDDEGHLSVQ